MRSSTGEPAAPSSGSSASIGMTAMSWNSRIANTAWPPLFCSAPRSVSGCSASAVEESASAMPATMPMRRLTPASQATVAISAIEPSTCETPSVSRRARMFHRRLGSSSRPMTKSRNTTPSSAMWRTSSTLSTSFRPKGPMAMPANR